MQNIARWRPDVTCSSVLSASKYLIDYEIVPIVKDILTPGWDVGVRRYPDSYYDTLSKQVAGVDDGFDPDFDPEEDGTLREKMLEGFYSVPKVYDETEDFQACVMYGPSTRPLHGCVVDADTKIPYCRLENFRIDSSKIESSSGGEDVRTVMGRDEGLEFPKYLQGALIVAKDVVLPDGIDRSLFFFLDDVLNAISTAPALPCVRTVLTPTLFITRYEYVSLTHTLSDLWNAFMVMSKETSKSTHVVFLDAHAKGFLHSVWNCLFGSVDRVKQLPEGGVCFKNAIFIPTGFLSTLSPLERMLLLSKPCPSMTNAFVDFVVNAYGLENEVVDQGRATILDRVPFVSHSRSNSSHEERAIANLDVLEGKVKHMTNATTVQIVDLLQEPFLDQLRLIRQSHVLIGHSDSGISQMIFMQNGTHVFKLGDA